MGRYIMTNSVYHTYLLLLALVVLMACIKPTTADNVNRTCVCNHHPSLPVLPKPASGGEPLSYMYRGDCLVEIISPIFQLDKYAMVAHLGNIGYIRDDAMVSHDYCTFYLSNGRFSFVSVLGHQTTVRPQPITTQSQHRTTNQHTPTIPPTHVTTSRPTATLHPITSPPPSSTTNKITSLHPMTAAPLPVCNKVALFNEIARSISVGTSRSLLCPDGTHHESDAAIMALCGAPTPSLWLRGMKVIDNCPILPKYTPVAQFDQTMTYKQSAGVFLGCEGNSIFMATQDCSSSIHITQIDTHTAPDVHQLYVVEW